MSIVGTRAISRISRPLVAPSGSSIRKEVSQSTLLAEALNLLFEKYGESPIARLV